MNISITNGITGIRIEYMPVEQYNSEIKKEREQNRLQYRENMKLKMELYKLKQKNRRLEADVDSMNEIILDLEACK